jgi:hypothetical protein
MSLIQVTKPALQFPFNGSNVDSITNLSPIFSTEGANTFEAGKYNQAIRFNNTGTTVSSNLAYNTQTFTFSQGITLAAWIKYNSFLASTQNQAIDFYGTGGFFGIWATNTNKWNFFTGTTQLDTGISIVLGQWTHVAVWTNGTNMTMYVQGVATSATQATTGSNTCNKLAIASSDLGNNPAAVSVQDLRIYNSALTDIQVQSLYANGGAPGVPPSTTIKTQPFPPNYNYLADITDYSSNPINLATYAASSVVQNANSPFPAEYSFDITTVSGAPQPPSNSAAKCAYYFLNQSKLNFDFFSATSNSFLECWLYVPIGSTLSSYPWIAARYPAASKNDYDWQIGTGPVSGSNIPIGMGFTDQFGNRIGASGLGSINATVGQWNHVTMGWSSVSSRVYIGVNGNIVSGTRNLSSNASQYLETANTVIGRQQWDSGCLLSNFRLVSLGVNILPYTTTYTVPTSPLDIYPTGTTALLIRSHQIMTMTGTPLLSQLSVAPVAAFSLRAVGGTTARAVQVVRSSDSATQDFYADRLGNLLTAPVIGQSLSDWLGGSTGAVATWYDQSGNGNHATQGTQANRPVINVATSPYSIIGGGWVTVPTFSFNFGNGAGYSLRMVVGNTVGGCVAYKGTTTLSWTTDYKHWSFGPGGVNTSETAPGLFPYCVGNTENWTYSGTAITTAKTSVTYVAINNTTNATTVYINGSSVALNGNFIPQTLRSDPQPAFVIGNGGAAGSSTAPFNGNIYEVLVFPKPLSASDVTLMGT